MENEQKASDERDKAKAWFKMARDAVDQYQTQVSENPELKAKGLERLRTKLLESAAQFHEKFTAAAADDPELRAEQGRALLRLAEIYLDTNRYDRAVTTVEEALTISNRLAETNPKEQKYRQLLGQVYSTQGYVYRSRISRNVKNFHAFKTAMHRAIDIQKQLADAHPKELEYQTDLAESYNILGMNAVEEREYAWTQALEICRQLVAAFPEEKRPQMLLTTTLTNWVFDIIKTSPKKAVELGEEGLRVARKLAKAHPDDPEVLLTVAGIATNLGSAYAKTERFEEAEALFQETVAIGRRTSSEHPSVQEYQNYLIYGLGGLGSVYMKTKRIELAEKTLEEGLMLLRRNLRTDPDATGSLSNAGQLLNKLAIICRDTKRIDRAIASWQEAISMQKKAAMAYPGSSGNHLNEIYSEFIKYYRETNQLALADATLRDQMLFAFQLMEKHPEDQVVYKMFIDSYMSVLTEVVGAERRKPFLQDIEEQSAKLAVRDPKNAEFALIEARASLELDKIDRGLARFEQSLRISKETLGADHPTTLQIMQQLANVYLQFNKPAEEINTLKELVAAHSRSKPSNERALADVRLQLGIALLDSGKALEAARELGLVVSVIRQKQPNNTLGLSRTLVFLGMALVQSGQPVEAEPLVRECLAIREKNEPDAWSTFNTLSLLGGSLLGQKKYAEAEPLLLKGYEGMKAREKTIPPQGDTRIPEAVDRLIELYTATNKPDELKKWQEVKAKLPKRAEKKP